MDTTVTSWKSYIGICIYNNIRGDWFCEVSFDSCFDCWRNISVWFSLTWMRGLNCDWKWSTEIQSNITDQGFPRKTLVIFRSHEFLKLSLYKLSLCRVTAYSKHSLGSLEAVRPLVLPICTTLVSSIEEDPETITFLGFLMFIC